MSFISVTLGSAGLEDSRSCNLFRGQSKCLIGLKARALWTLCVQKLADRSVISAEVTNSDHQEEVMLLSHNRDRMCGTKVIYLEFLVLPWLTVTVQGHMQKPDLKRAGAHRNEDLGHITGKLPRLVKVMVGVLEALKWIIEIGEDEYKLQSQAYCSIWVYGSSH
jgi:hypothetical protein